MPSYKQWLLVHQCASGWNCWLWPSDRACSTWQQRSTTSLKVGYNQITLTLIYDDVQFMRMHMKRFSTSSKHRSCFLHYIIIMQDLQTIDMKYIRECFWWALMDKQPHCKRGREQQAETGWGTKRIAAMGIDGQADRQPHCETGREQQTDK